MLPAPAPDNTLISIYADGDMLPFIVSSLRMAQMLLGNEQLAFDLKTAVLERGLLSAAAVRDLLRDGERVIAAAGHALAIAPDDAPEPTDDDENRIAWHLTLADVLLIATANDFMASAYLTSFGEDMRAVQVNHNGIPGAVYDAQLHETLGYLARFQAEWGELFGELAPYQVRMAELEVLRAEFVG
jgi:hypothetical protein